MATPEAGWQTSLTAPVANADANRGVAESADLQQSSATMTVLLTGLTIVHFNPAS